MNEGKTAQVQGWLDRLRGGDLVARDELFRCASEQLLHLTRKMLRDYPGVGRWAETDDVLQNAAMRLHRALATVSPPTARDFFRLAAAQVRRELIDLARHYFGPEGAGAHHHSQAAFGAADGSQDVARAEVPADSTHDPGRLANWTEFHQRVQGLPDEAREAFDLLWYQGLTQAEAAEILGVSERTVKRRWLAARLELGEALGATMPP